MSVSLCLLNWPALRRYLFVFSLMTYSAHLILILLVLYNNNITSNNNNTDVVVLSLMIFILPVLSCDHAYSCLIYKLTYCARDQFY